MGLYVGTIEREEFVLDEVIGGSGIGVVRIGDNVIKAWCSTQLASSKMQIVPIIGGKPDLYQVIYLTHVYRNMESLDLFDLIKSPLGVDLSKILLQVLRPYTRNLTVSGFLYGWPSSDNYAPERIDYDDFGVVNPELRSLLLME